MHPHTHRHSKELLRDRGGCECVCCVSPPHQQIASNESTSSVLESRTLPSKYFTAFFYLKQKPRPLCIKVLFSSWCAQVDEHPGAVPLSLPSLSNLISKRRPFKSTLCSSSFRTTPQETIIAINFQLSTATIGNIPWAASQNFLCFCPLHSDWTLMFTLSGILLFCHSKLSPPTHPLQSPHVQINPTWL